MPANVYIYVEGGVVHNVWSNEVVNVVVLDLDDRDDTDYVDKCNKLDELENSVLYRRVY